jgi:subtilisin family serine protease
MNAGGAVSGVVASDILNLINLSELMARTSGSPQIAIGLVDGPVSMTHPDLATENIREVAGSTAACTRADSLACQHGTFVAGLLAAKRESPVRGICPACTLLVRPVFVDRRTAPDRVPAATPEELAAAIGDAIDAGVRLVNVSAAISPLPAVRGARALELTLDRAWHLGAIVVAAAGNEGTVGGTSLTQHRAVIAVSACDRSGRPVSSSNLGWSIGRRGLAAPGEDVTSLGTDTATISAGGTSVAAPFVTGALALAWSQFPQATAGQVRLAVVLAHRARRRSVIPALLNAEGVYLALGQLVRRGLEG